MFRKLWKQAFSNLDSSIAIIISIFAAFYGLFNADSPLLAAISGTLGLVAYGMIKDRNARDELLKQVQHLKEPPNIGALLLDRDDYISFKDLIGPAHKIYLVGPTLVSLFNGYSDYFRDTKLRGHGATIQAVILDPQGPAVESAANCINQPLEKIKAEIENTKLSVGSILAYKDGLKNGKIELRTLSTSLNFSMVLIDPDMPNGKIFVEFLGYHAGLRNVPHIELIRSRDEKWYQFFLQQYNHIYEDSEVCLTN